MSEPTLGEVFRTGVEAKAEIAELRRQLNQDRADRGNERHAFREELHRTLIGIQNTQKEQTSLIARQDERLAVVGALNQTLYSQANSIGELQNAAKVEAANRETIIGMAKDISSLATELKMVSNMGGRSLSILMVALTGLMGSVIGGLLIWAITRKATG